MSDSRHDTHEHIAAVRGLLLGCAEDLLERGHRHDRSKLTDPELAIFDEYGPKLRETTYGSAEYKSHLAEMEVALDHHYAENDHHPEHFGKGHNEGIHRMTLLQLTEMLCDWIAASRRHGTGGDVRKSIDMNTVRFGYGHEIRQLLMNSVEPIIGMEVPVE